MFRGGAQDLASEGLAAGGGRALALVRPARFPQLDRLIDSPLGNAVDRLAGADLVVDLGARIGSREWFRGLITCLSLCTAAGLMVPDFRPIRLPAEPQMGAAQYEQARTLAIAPLALGADTGRRLAPTAQVETLGDTPERPRVELTATLGQGDGFVRVLERAGVARSEAAQVATLVEGAVPLDDLRAGTRMDLVLGRRESKHEARPLENLAFRARFDLKLAVERLDGALRLQRIPIHVDNTPLRIQGRVGSSLYRSARAAGLPAGAIETFIKAVSKKLSMRSIGSDARFDAIVEHARAETGEVKVGELLYAGITEGKKKVQMLKWTTGGRQQWYEASGVGESKGVMQRPVLGHLTSTFGMRMHPILGYSRMHQGVDFGAPMGAPIVAATDGVIAFAGRHGGHGNYVRISHSGGIATGYAHMSRIIARVGERVRQGQLIGYVGSTGLSTGPHLHYEMYRDGRPINPTSLKFTTVQQLSGRELANFRAKLSNLLAVRVAGPAAASEPSTKKAEADDRAKPRKG